MKALFVACCLIVPFFECYCQKANLPIRVSIRIDSSYDKRVSATADKEYLGRKHFKAYSDTITHRYFTVTIEIKNLSDTTIGFWAMKCSWADNLVVNNSYAYVRPQVCDSNFPEIVELEPGKSKYYEGELCMPCADCDLGPHVETTRVGLILIDDIYKHKKNMLTYDTAMEDKSLWQIVWSNPLYLLKALENKLPYNVQP